VAGGGGGYSVLNGEEGTEAALGVGPGATSCIFILQKREQGTVQ
jgi:hypothetical protein